MDSGACSYQAGSTGPSSFARIYMVDETYGWYADSVGGNYYVQKFIPISTFDNGVIDAFYTEFGEDITALKNGNVYESYGTVYKDNLGRWWLCFVRVNVAQVYELDEITGLVKRNPDDSPKVYFLEPYVNQETFDSLIFAGNCLVVRSQRSVTTGFMQWYNIDTSVSGATWPIQAVINKFSYLQNARDWWYLQQGYVAADRNLGTWPGNVFAASIADICPVTPAYADEIIADLCERVGLPVSQYDVTGIARELIGYVRTGVMSARSAMAPLQNICRFDIVSVNGKILFQQVCNASGDTGLTILEDDLAVRPYGSEAPEALTLRRVQPTRTGTTIARSRRRRTPWRSTRPASTSTCLR